MKETTYTIQRCDFNGDTNGFENSECPPRVRDKIAIGIALGAMENFVESKFHDRETGFFYIVKEI